jgi:hypothetical protein
MAKAFTLTNIPEDVFKILLKEQYRMKHNRQLGRYGLAQTVYKIVRDYERCRDAEKEGKK